MVPFVLRLGRTSRAKGEEFRGSHITTLPTVIKEDLFCIPAGALKLTTKNDLNHLMSTIEVITQ